MENRSSEKISIPVSNFDWSNILPEVLEIILNHIKGDTSALLKCRAMNLHWKHETDAFMEKQALSLWSTWDPFYPSTISNETFPKKTILGPCARLCCTSEIDHSPPKINPCMRNPFPSKSLHVEFDTKHQGIFETEQLQLFKTFLGNYGHHLTSLILSEFQLSIEILKKVLSRSRFLKALSVIGISLHGTSVPFGSIVLSHDSTPLLPPLPVLTHLKVLSCERKVSETFLHAYGHQLLSFETNLFIPNFPRGFENLKELKTAPTIRPNLRFPQLTYFPGKLEKFSVHYCGEAYPLYQVVEAIENFPGSLVRLHLDISIRDCLGESEIFGNQDPFTNLKFLAIPYPKDEKEARVVAVTLLQRFPNLEKLNFLHYFYWLEYDSPDSDDDDDDHYQYDYEKDVEKKIKKLLHIIDYWSICEKLKSISFYKEGYESSCIGVAKREGVE